MASDMLLAAEHMVTGGRTLNEKFWSTAMWFGVGIAIYLTFSNTIGSFANPLLASLKLSATPT
jgi:hypothetical protein